jgi:hypothetical protein
LPHDLVTIFVPDELFFLATIFLPGEWLIVTRLIVTRLIVTRLIVTRLIVTKVNSAQVL